MTQVVYLHVGGPKSGTTFIQQVLEHNAAALAKAGVLVVGPRLELIHAAMVVRGDAASTTSRPPPATPGTGSPRRCASGRAPPRS